MTEPTPEELAERYADDNFSVLYDGKELIRQAFLAGLAEGERRRQKRDAEIVQMYDDQDMRQGTRDDIAAAILTEGGRT